jgi:hypothetical protein
MRCRKPQASRGQRGVRVVQQHGDCVKVIALAQVAIENGRARLVRNPDAVVQRFGECYASILDYTPAMPKAVGLVVFILLSALATSAQDGPLLVRRYVEGEQLQYLMKAQNDGGTYEVRINGIVKRLADTHFIEEFSFSDLMANGKSVTLSPSAQEFRAVITLRKGEPPFAAPDLSKAPRLVGPITDLLTFYSDLFLAMFEGNLRKPGDRFYVPNPIVPSWADGNVVVIGEDAIDFDITLTDMSAGVASLLIKHVPPAQPKIRIPAEWMRPPVADTPNNWVQVRKTKTGFAASIGKETFDVELRIDLADGKILAARMENPVTKITRECSNATLTDCGEARRDPTLRRIEMTLLRD